MPASSSSIKKVSVIIPVYNTGELAIKLVLKILKGPYKNLEFILVDDGSTDDSLAFLKEFKRQFDLKSKKSPAKLVILSKDNGGASSARNVGLDKASGDYVCFIDSDDSVDSKYIKALTSALEKYDNYNSVELRVALVGSALKYNRVAKNQQFDLYTNESKPQLPDESFEDYILRLFNTDGRLHAVNNKIYRRNIIEHFSIRFDEKINFAEDVKFNLDYLKAAHRVKYNRLSFILEPLYFYNFGTKTSTVTLSSLSWSNWEKSLQNLVKWVGKHPTKKQIKLLKHIRFRWKLSHALAVARSNQSFGHKCQHASLFLVIPALVVVKFRR